MITVTSYLAIGSNLGDREINIKKSLQYLKSIPRIKIKKISRVYETLPQGGPKFQPKYLNTVVKIRTTLSPLELLSELKVIELKLKRKKIVHWGARTIDLDILFYDSLIFMNNRLTIPHPLLHKRIFVLKPLTEIAPDFIHPLYRKNIRGLLKKLGRNSEKIISFNR